MFEPHKFMRNLYEPLTKLIFLNRSKFIEFSPFWTAWPSNLNRYNWLAIKFFLPNLCPCYQFQNIKLISFKASFFIRFLWKFSLILINWFKLKLLFLRSSRKTHDFWHSLPRVIIFSKTNLASLNEREDSFH